MNSTMIKESDLLKTIIRCLHSFDIAGLKILEETARTKRYQMERELETQFKDLLK